MKPHLLENEILRLLAERGAKADGSLKTICPSEVARAVAGSEDRVKWEPLMQPVRDAAAKLVNEGKLVFTQRGRIVDGATAKGPLRLRLH